MKNCLPIITGWSRSGFYKIVGHRFLGKVFIFIFLTAMFTIAFLSIARAQTEQIDSINTKSDVLERIREALRDPASQTPYNIDIPESEVNRYELKDYGSNHRFYRHLKYRTAEDYLMSEQEGYDPYGPEWERRLNENLMKVLRATFKEESEIMKLWKRIAPFLAFGIWEPYEVPITRVEHPQKVRVIEDP